MGIRRVAADDAPRIHAILVATGVFTPAEVECADELVAEAIHQPEKGDYLVHVLEHDGVVVGYVCYGATPLTDGTYDLYWIAVDPACHGHGHGQRLIAFVESELRSSGGRLLLIETSGKDSYGPTQSFYLRCGYRELARIPGFYRPGDDKIVYGKYLD
ncbi:N-acetyltransferase [Nannocystis sp.]|uniref:GNAT family N-acetyltransferase n=1 Tax=Nannocystis sp. TaxID=1962667 RepID=UPI0025CF2B87|nr:N-acetyltransferase [Nannocystis sp.]MBK7824413.1 GNAT family N-acetyltransferase [Nannocystis sp.]